MNFNPNEHLMTLKGKNYLQVMWRLVWFREDHPASSGWGIQTEVKQFDDKMAVVHCRIVDDSGRVVATGTKSESPRDFGDYLEKAETGSIGRALAALGYGTQFAPELDEEERIVDSPVERKPAKAKQNPNDPITSEQVLILWRLAKAKGYTKEQFAEEVKKVGFASSAEITVGKYGELYDLFNNFAPGGS